MSYIHFKTVYNLNFDKITFDGSSIPLVQLKKLISEKTKFVKTKKVDFDLEISNIDTNIVYTNEQEHIFKNARVIVKRVIKNSTEPLRAQDKSISSENLKQNQVCSNLTIDSLAPLNFPSKPLVYMDDKQNNPIDSHLDEQGKLDSILMSSMYKTLNGTSVQTNRFLGIKQQMPKPICQPMMQPRPIPPGYLCVICRKPGHLRQFCPEAGTLPKPEDRPKFPSGIPKKNLHPAQPGDKFAMLGPEGYVVNEIEKEAAKTIKKENYLFDEKEEKKIENRENFENPKEFMCPFGDHLIKDAVQIPCCEKFICCDTCIRTKIYNEDLIECPYDKFHQKIDSFTAIIPCHEMRKKIEEFINESKKLNQVPIESKSQEKVSFDDISIQIEKKSPVQENKISSSENNFVKTSSKIEPSDFKLVEPYHNSRMIHHSLSESSLIKNNPFNNTYRNDYCQNFKPNFQTYENFLPQNNYQPNFNPYLNYSYNMQNPNCNGYHQNFQQCLFEDKIVSKVVEYDNLDRTLDIMTEKEFNEYKEKLLNDVNKIKENDKKNVDKLEKIRRKKSKKSRSRSRSKTKTKKSKKNKKNKVRSRSSNRDRIKSRSKTRSYSRSRSRSKLKIVRNKSIYTSSRSRSKSPCLRKIDNIDNKKKIVTQKYRNDDRNNARTVLRSLSRSPSKYFDKRKKR